MAHNLRLIGSNFDFFLVKIIPDIPKTNSLKMLNSVQVALI